MIADPACACGCPTSKHRPYSPDAPWAQSVFAVLPPPGGAPPHVEIPPEYTAGLVWCPEAVHVLHLFEDKAALDRRNELRRLDRELSWLSPLRFRRRREIRERIAAIEGSAP